MEAGLQGLDHQDKLVLWSKRISACRSSGMNVKAWCEENGVCLGTYYKWQKTLYQMTVGGAYTPTGVTASAVTFGIIQTAKESGLDPFRYLAYIFKNAPALA